MEGGGAVLGGLGLDSQGIPAGGSPCCLQQISTVLTHSPWFISCSRESIPQQLQAPHFLVSALLLDDPKLRHPAPLWPP